MEKTSTGLTQNLAGLLCYVLRWVTGIVFLIIEKDNKFVRFHAWQSIITFGALTVASWVLSVIPLLNVILVPLIGILALVLWIVLMVKAYGGQMWKVPIAGNIAASQK